MSTDDLLDRIYDGDLEGVRRVLGQIVTLRNAPDGLSLVAVACNLGHSQIAEELVASGALIDGAALLAAAHNGSVRVAEALLARGLDPDLADSDGQTPLMVAAKGDHDNVVRLLLESGARADKKDARGRTALHWALTEADGEVVVGLLLHAGLDPLAASGDGLSAIDYATKLGRRRSIALMLTSR
jgi:ankyrin repeat protein